jgi:restriction endonuclease S subunit
MTPEQQQMVNHLIDLDRKIGSTQFNLEQMSIGKQAFIDMLKKSLAE